MAEVELAELEAALVALAARIDTSGGEDLLDAVAARLGLRDDGAAEAPSEGAADAADDDAADDARGPGAPGARAGRARRRAWAAGGRGRAWLAAAVVLAVLALGIGLSPRARHAVADLLGLRGVDIEPVAPPLPPSIPAGGWSSGLRAVGEDEAAALLGRPLRRLGPDRFGQPASWTVTDGRAAGGPAGLVVAYYPPSAELPASAVPEVGALLYQFVGETEAPMLRKVVPPGGVEPVSVGGRPGFWVSGADQVGVVDRNGQFAPDTVRLAGATLLWSDGDVTFRLESGLDRDAAVAVAGSLR